MANEAASGTGRKPAQPKVNVLRCRGEGCGALMPYEETDAGYLLGQAIELAEVDGQKLFFPCPRCGGRQLVEEFVLDGKKRTRVCGFEPAP